MSWNEYEALFFNKLTKQETKRNEGTLDVLFISELILIQVRPKRFIPPVDLGLGCGEVATPTTLEIVRNRLYWQIDVFLLVAFHQDH